MTKELDQRVLLGVSARDGLTPAKREEREMESMLKLGCLLLECGGGIKEGRSRASFDFARKIASEEVASIRQSLLPARLPGYSTRFTPDDGVGSSVVRRHGRAGTNDQHLVVCAN